MLIIPAIGVMRFVLLFYKFQPPSLQISRAYASIKIRNLALDWDGNIITH